MKKKKRILHVGDKLGVRGSSVHGVGRLFSWWFSRFDSENYDVSLLILRKEDKSSETLRSEGVNLEFLGKGKYDFTTIETLIRYIRTRKPHILHLHGYGASNFGLIAAKLTRTKTIVHEHFVDPSYPKYQIPFDYLLARYADVGIAVSKSVRNFMIQERYFNANKVRVIYNGAPLDGFKPVDKTAVQKEKEKWGIPEGYKIITTIGRLDEQKGNKYFVEAAAQLLRNGKKVKFLIVGDGPYMGILRDQALKLGIQEHIVFTGYCSDITSIQTMTDVQVFPSLWEGTPLTVFEAMAMGKAIVSTNVDGLGEVLKDRKNALIVEPRNALALSDSIGEILGNGKKMLELERQAKEDSKRYDIRITVNNLQKEYDKLADNMNASERRASR